MKVVAAYLLALLSGNSSPCADDVKNILSSVGVEADDDKLDLFFTSIKGKDVNEVLALGRERFASSGGGGGVAVAASAGGGGAAAPAEEAKEEKKEEKKEAAEESDDDMGFSLFD